MSVAAPSPVAIRPTEIVSTRVFSVPREQLFEAFENPNHLIHWWGPQGFTHTFHEFDPRPGGDWRFVMHGPDGADYPNHKKFIEVVRPDRIVFQHLHEVHGFTMTMTLVEESQGTRLTWRMRFESAEEGEKLKDFIASANEENLDRLETYLSTMPAADEFVLTRVFDAPRSVVYQAWTEASILSEWWAPHSFTNPVCELDVRPGGAYRIVMRSPDEVDYPLRGVYQEVCAPERLVMTMDCSEHPAAWHNVVKPGRSAEETNPVGEIVATVSFTEHEGRTTLTLRIRFQTAALRDVMVGMNMSDGWNESFDSLAALVARSSREK